MDSVVRKSTYYDQKKPKHHYLNRSRLKWDLCLSLYCTDQTPVGHKKYFPFEPSTKRHQRVVTCGPWRKQGCVMVRIKCEESGKVVTMLRRTRDSLLFAITVNHRYMKDSFCSQSHFFMQRKSTLLWFYSELKARAIIIDLIDRLE